MSETDVRLSVHNRPAVSHQGQTGFSLMSAHDEAYINRLLLGRSRATDVPADPTAR